MKSKKIVFNRVVTRNIICDIVSKFQNLFGQNLTFYEDMMDKTHNQIFDELKKKQIELKWYRFEHAQLSNGAIAVTFYGEKK